MYVVPSPSSTEGSQQPASTSEPRPCLEPGSLRPGRCKVVPHTAVELNLWNVAVCVTAQCQVEGFSLREEVEEVVVMGVLLPVQADGRVDECRASAQSHHGSVLQRFLPFGCKSNLRIPS